MNAQSPAQKSRLNPFLFPSETDLMFVLLMVVLLAESLFTYSYLQSSIYMEPQMKRTLECIESTGYFESIQQFDPQMLSLFNSEPAANWANQADENSRMFQKCMRNWDLSRALWGIGGFILLAAVTFGIYWITPAQKIKQGRYVPLLAEDAGEVLDYLKLLCVEACLAKEPLFFWNPLTPSVSGLAFGRFGKYYVAIPGGLVTQYYTDRPAFRSVIFHELAHLYNRDIDKTYLTMSAWQAFIFVVIIPQITMVIISPMRQLFNGLENVGLFFNSLIYALMFAIDAAILFALVYLARNTILRTRETYADIRASVWDGTTDHLISILQPRLSTSQNIPEFLQKHPDPQKRISRLKDTAPLFSIGLMEVLMIGIAAMVGADEIRDLLLLLLPFFPKEEIVAGLVTGLLYSIILVGILGTLVWRSVFLSQMVDRPHSRAFWWKVGMVLGFGSAIGASITFANTVNVLHGPLNIVLVLILNIFLGIFLGVAFSLFLGWMAGNADVWLPAASTPKQMGKFYIILSVLSVITMTFWLGWAFAAWSPGNAVLTFFGLIAGVPLAAANPISILFFMLLWLCPLMIFFWLKNIDVLDLGWAFLDTPVQTPKIRPHQLSLRKAVLVGLISGLLFAVSDFFISILLRYIVPASTRESDEYKIISFIIYIILAMFIQVFIAAIVAFQVRNLKVSHGLLASFVGGSIMAIGFTINNLLLGGGLMGIVFPWMLNTGAIFALPVLLFITAIASPSRSQTSPS